MLTASSSSAVDLNPGYCTKLDLWETNQFVFCVWGLIMGDICYMPSDPGGPKSKSIWAVSLSVESDLGMKKVRHNHELEYETDTSRSGEVFDRW
jgi:hypothetical protein